eukprot:Gb_08668 [translate_table: standard]
MGDNKVESNGKVENKFGIIVERMPSESRLSDLGIRSWPKPSYYICTGKFMDGCSLIPTIIRILIGMEPVLRRRGSAAGHGNEWQAQFEPLWGCPPGRFPLTFDAEQTCYLVKGKVKAYPKGSSEYIEFGAGDLAVFPKGLSCTWDVCIAVDKHYKFDH